MRRERAHLDTHWHALGIHQVQDDSRVSSENTTHPAAQRVNLVEVSKPPPSMQLSTTETIPGHTIEKSIGLVEGSTVRSKNVGRDLMASLKNFVGGELKGYTELLEESRKEATNRMIAKAKKKGANAILNVRYTTSNIAPGASEILVYGTAVIAAPPCLVCSSIWLGCWGRLLLRTGGDPVLSSRTRKPFSAKKKPWNTFNS